MRGRARVAQPTRVVRSRPGLMRSAGVWGPLIQRWLHDLLPADAATVCSGRVGLFVLAIWPPLPHHLLVSEFQSKDDLVEAAMASVHIPYFLDGHMTCVCTRVCLGLSVLTQAAAPALRRRFRSKRCIDGSVAARRDLVDTRRTQPVPSAPPTLLLDHNADPQIASSRKFGDFVELATREGLQRMVDAGYAYMRAELESGRLDALCAAAPLPSGLVL